MPAWMNRRLAIGTSARQEPHQPLEARAVRRPEEAEQVQARLSEHGDNGFAVEGLTEPGHGQAFVIGGHIMRDTERFRPYAEAVSAVVQGFGGRFLARGGTVTPLHGAFVPERVVLIEFPTAEDALKFYTSDRYAALLKIRLATTEARFLIMARSGELPEPVRTAAEAFLRRSA